MGTRVRVAGPIGWCRLTVQPIQTRGTAGSSQAAARTPDRSARVRGLHPRAVVMISATVVTAATSRAIDAGVDARQAEAGYTRVPVPVASAQSERTCHQGSRPPT